MSLNIYLPHKYERIGWILIGLHAVLLSTLLLLDVTNQLPETLYSFGFTIRILFKYTLMIGLVFVICSKEKIEDELVRTIRLKAFQQGLLFTLGLSLLMFFVTLIFRQPLIFKSVEGIDATLIFIAIIYKYNMYKFKKENS